MNVPIAPLGRRRGHSRLPAGSRWRSEPGAASVLPARRAFAIVARSMLAVLCAVTLADCGSAAPTPAAPTVEPAGSAPVATSTTAEIAGALGRTLAIPGVATVRVDGATGWVPDQRPLPAGYRLVVVRIVLTAVATRLAISADSLDLIDGTLTRYRPVKRGQPPQIALPTDLGPGSTASGNVTFQVPEGGDYSLEFVPGPGVVATVVIPRIAPAPGPSAAPQAIVAPSIQGTMHPTPSRVASSPHR
jgi:hypothetical protein